MHPPSKHVLSVSLGDPARDQVSEITLAGQRVRLERRGTGGDRRRAAALLREYDGQVDAFGLGGIDLGLEVDGRLYPLQAGLALARIVRHTPIVDGTGLKRTLERQAAGFVERTLGPVSPRRVLLTSGADRWGLALGFADAGYDLVLGDLMFAFGLAWPLRSLAAGKRLARLVLPLVGRMPFEWLYPTGARQAEWRPRFERWFAWASVIAGDRHYLMRHRPARLEGKIIVTNTTTRADIETLFAAGARAVITTTPILDGRSFGANVLEAALVAVAGYGRALSADELQTWVTEAGLGLCMGACSAAGSIPRTDDPLNAHTHGGPKALLPIHGRPMIQYVLDALGGATRIRNVVLVGLSAEQRSDLTCRKPLHFLPGCGALIDNLGAAAEWAAALPEPPTHLLATSCDIPLLTAAMVDANVSAALETDHDGYFNLIPRRAMEQRFPGVRRSFFRIAEGEFCSADLNLIALRAMRDYNPAWGRILEARKNVLAMARIAGTDFLLRGLLGRLSIPWGQQRLRERLGIDGRIVFTDQAETGMDVDRPEHLKVVAAELGTEGPAC